MKKQGKRRKARKMNHFSHFEWKYWRYFFWKSFENSNLLIHGVSETVKRETKKHEGVFLGMLLRTLPEP